VYKNLIKAVQLSRTSIFTAMVFGLVGKALVLISVVTPHWA